MNKLADVRSKLADRLGMESALASLIAHCGALPERVNCPLIAALHRHDHRRSLPSLAPRHTVHPNAMDGASAGFAGCKNRPEHKK